MSGILPRESQTTESTDDTGRSQLQKAVKAVMKQANGGSSGGGNGRLSGTYLVIDVGEVTGSLLGGRGETTGIAETAAELAPEPERISGSGGSQAGQGSRGRRGGGRLTRLFLLGAVVGLGYALRRRSGSVDEVVDQATERTQAVAGTAAERTQAVAGTAAERIQEGSQQVAEQIEEGGEQVSERVEETGEQAAEQIEESGEQATEVEEEAAEAATEVEEEAAQAVEEGTDESEGETDEE